MSQQRSLNLVQLLRGIASLLVVLLHTTVNVNENFGIPFLGNFFAFGGAGVDIFFVLSGFIITYSSKKALAARSNYFVFLKRRFVRIFPTYWIIITGFIILQLLLPSFYRTHYPLGGGNLLSTYLLLPDHIMVNGVSWTLSYELFFYFLFSLAFIVRSQKILFAGAILYVAALIAIPLFHIEHSNKWVKLITFPMNIEFFMGILAALIIPKLSAKASLPFIIFGAVTFLAAGVFSNSGHGIVSNEFNRVILFGVPSFFIIAGIVRYELNRQINMHSVLISLGEASYSLYLIHLLIVVAAIKLLLKLHFTNSLAIHAFCILLIIAICALSILFFKWIEKPLIKRLNKVL